MERPDFGGQDRHQRQIAIDKPGDRPVGQPQRLKRIIHQADIVVEHELELKPTRTGENIIGNIMSVRRGALAPCGLVDQKRQSQPQKHFQIECDGQKNTVRRKAAQNTQSLRMRS